MQKVKMSVAFVMMHLYLVQAGPMSDILQRPRRSDNYTEFEEESMCYADVIGCQDIIAPISQRFDFSVGESLPSILRNRTILEEDITNVLDQTSECMRNVSQGPDCSYQARAEATYFSMVSDYLHTVNGVDNIIAMSDSVCLRELNAVEELREAYVACTMPFYMGAVHVQNENICVGITNFLRCTLDAMTNTCGVAFGGLVYDVLTHASETTYGDMLMRYVSEASQMDFSSCTLQSLISSIS